MNNSMGTIKRKIKTFLKGCLLCYYQGVAPFPTSSELPAHQTTKKIGKNGVVFFHKNSVDSSRNNGML